MIKQNGKSGGYIMNKFFPEIKKNFGFGCMRFPTVDEKVDIAAVMEMVDHFMAEGFNYFDTAQIGRATSELQSPS